MAYELVQYYETVRHTINAGNIQWTTVMNNFDIQWEPLMEKKSKDKPETLKISKILNIMQWSKDFSTFYIGVLESTTYQSSM